MKGLKSIKSYLKLICMIFIFATIILLLQIDSNAVEISNINVELTTNRPAKEKNSILV